MKIDRIYTANINFRENTLSRQMDSQDAILMLRDPKALVKFQQNREYAKKADSVDSNPLTALGYKLYRTFNLITESENSQAETKQFNKIA